MPVEDEDEDGPVLLILILMGRLNDLLSSDRSLNKNNNDNNMNSSILGKTPS